MKNNINNAIQSENNENDFFKSRKFKCGSIATIITVCAIVVTVILNIIMNTLDTKFSIHYDLTSNNFFSVSQATKDYIANLDQDIEILVLDTQENFRNVDNEYYIQASNVINQYSQNSNRITVQYLDLDKNPNITALYAEEDIPVKDDIIIKTADDYRILTSDDLFEGEYSYYSYNYTITSSKAEQAITSAMLNLTTKEKTKVEFIIGYEEEDYTVLKTLLENNNYEVSETKILTSYLSNDSKIAFIYAPTRDYDKESIDKLNSFMEKGKNEGKSIVYVASPEAKDTPILNSFLANWGINVGSGNVFETDYNNLFSTSSAFYTIAQYGNSDYTNSLKSTKIPVALPICKPITLTAMDSVTETELLSFSSKSGVHPIDASTDWQITEESITGPITAACLSTKTSDGISSNVCAIGTSLAFDESMIKRSALNNSAYFTNLFNGLSEKDNGVIIESKSMDYDSLNITTTQSVVLGVMFAVIIPIILVFVGIFIWIRRRNR